MKKRKNLWESTARAESAVNIIAWLTAIAAVLLVVFWFVRNNPYAYLKAVDEVDEDVLQLAERINGACNTDSYYSEYNPITQLGLASFRPGTVCVTKKYLVGTLNKADRRLQRCADTVCVLDIKKNIDLDNITYVTIRKDGITVISAK